MSVRITLDNNSLMVVVDGQRVGSIPLSQVVAWATEHAPAMLASEQAKIITAPSGYEARACSCCGAPMESK